MISTQFWRQGRMLLTFQLGCHLINAVRRVPRSPKP